MDGRIAATCADPNTAFTHSDHGSERWFELPTSKEYQQRAPRIPISTKPVRHAFEKE